MRQQLWPMTGLEPKKRMPVYEQIAAEECQKMYQRLQEIAVEHEENPAKIDWNC